MADICPVSGVGPLPPPCESRFLECETDSVTICVDSALPVTGSVAVTGTISTEPKDPGVPGTVVPGSRWHRTGFNSLAGTLTITSPTPTGSQRVVCTWADWSLVVASIGLGGTALRPIIYDGTVAGTIIWSTAIGLAGLANLGTTYSGDSDGLVLVGSPGNVLTFTLPVTLSIFDKTINFGGYIVEV